MRFFDAQKYLRKSVVIVLLAITLSFSPLQAQKADALWGEIPQQFLKEALEKVTFNIQGIIIGALKKAAIKMLNDNIGNLVSGNSSSDSKIIGDYRDFIYTDSSSKTEVYLNDYLSQVTGGKGSSSGYVSSAGFGSSGGGNYSSQLVEVAKKSLLEESELKMDYVGDPRENLFANGSMENFDSYLSGINNPWAFNLNTRAKYQERLEIEKDAARTEAIANKGFRSTRSGDTITTPGSLTGDNMANVMDLGNKVLAGATSTSETVSAIVSQFISQAIESGIGKAEENAQREGKASPWTNPDTAGSTGSETSNYINPDTGKAFQ